MSKRKPKIVTIEVDLPRIGPEAAIAMGRQVAMEDRRIDARNRTRTERNRRALED